MTDYEQHKKERRKLLNDLTDRIEKIEGVKGAYIQGGSKYYSESVLEISLETKGSRGKYYDIKPSLRSVSQQISSEISKTDRVSGHGILDKPEKQYSRDRRGKIKKHVDPLGYDSAVYIIEIGMA